MLANATRLCEAKFGVIVAWTMETYPVSPRCYNVPPALAAAQNGTNSAFIPSPARSARSRCSDEAGGAHCRHPSEPAYLEGDPQRSCPRRLGGARTLSPCRCSRKSGDRRDHHLSPGGPAVHRQADRAGAEFRDPGRHRHREHPPAQRAARIAAAADRHRRRAQGHQPLDLRPADGARHASRIGRTTLRGRYRTYRTSEKRRCSISAEATYGYSPDLKDIVERTPWSSRARRCDRSRPA